MGEPTDTEFLSASPLLLAPIMVQANGTTYARDNAWSGTNSPNAPATSDSLSCNSWTTSSASVGGVSGSNSFVGNGLRWLNGGHTALQLHGREALLPAGPLSAP